jgi:magnesium-transporting ATPase (P-type)
MGKKRESDALASHVSGQYNDPLSAPAHALSHEQLASELDVDPLTGLTASEAASRLSRYGRNELGEAEGPQLLKIIVAQVANAMTLVRPLPRPHVSVTPVPNKKTELIQLP